MKNARTLTMPVVTVRPEVIYRISVDGQEFDETFIKVGTMAGMLQLKARNGMSVIVDSDEPIGDALATAGIQDGYEAVVVKASPDFLARVKEEWGEDEEPPQVDGSDGPVQPPQEESPDGQDDEATVQPRRGRKPLAEGDE